MSLEAKINLAITAVLAGSNSFGPITFNPKVSKAQAFVDGAGAGQATKIYVGSRSLATGANESLDLAGGLSDAFNNVLTFAGVKALAIIAADANTTDLTIGNGTNPFIGPFGAAAHTIKVKPGGMFLITDPSAAGLTVTAGTGDVLKVENAAGATATYTLVVIGD
jgi:hypothetical protein